MDVKRLLGSSFILHPSSFKNEAYGAFAWAYDQALGKNFFASVAPLLDRVLERHRHEGRRHLDLACGTGLVVEYLAHHGYESIGLDASVPMLSVASGRARRLVCGDLRRLPFRGGRFSVVTSLYDSLNHLMWRRDLAAAFREMRRLMNDGGLLVFDMNQPAIYLSAWATSEPFEVKGSEYELRIDTMYSRWRRLGVGKVSGWARMNGTRIEISETRTQRAYSRRVIERALADAALEIVEVLEFDPFSGASTVPDQKAKWLFVARAA